MSSRDTNALLEHPADRQAGKGLSLKHPSAENRQKPLCLETFQLSSFLSHLVFNINGLGPEPSLSPSSVVSYVRAAINWDVGLSSKDPTFLLIFSECDEPERKQGLLR